MGLMGNVLGGVASLGLDLATAKWQDRRQLKQQGALQQQQIEGLKEMGQFNQGLQLEMLRNNQEWNSAAAQRKRLEDAGLNVGLMYGGSGAGGSTVSGQAGSGGSPSGGQAAGSQQGLGMAMTLAQIENLKATSKKTNAEAAKIEGVDTREGEARIENLAKDIELKGLDVGFNQIRNRIAASTEAIEVDKLNSELDNLIADLNLKLNEQEFKDLTLNDRVSAVYQEAIGVEIANELARANINKTEAEIDKMAQDVAIAWKNSGLIESAQVLQKKDLDRKERELAEAKHRNNIAAFEAQVKREYQPIWNVGGRGLDMFSRLGDRIFDDLFRGGYKGQNVPQR